jgi:hypothetical protein
VSSIFVEVFFFRSPFLLSCATVFVSYLVQFSWHPLLDFYAVSMVFQKTYMGVLWNFYGVSMIFCGVSKGVSVVLLLKATQNQLKAN